MTPQIALDKGKIADFCRHNHIRKLSLFGSVLGPHFRPDSDVDVLVVYKPGTVLGFKVFKLESELSALLGGRKVDLVPEKRLNPRLRGRVLDSAETVYAEG